MKQYFNEKIVFIPDLEGKWEVCDIKTANPIKGRFEMAKSGVIVLTEEELLDLLQECIEYTNVILGRGVASNFLKSKLND